MHASHRGIIAWGSYDTGKPRVRLLLDELRARQALDSEINIPVWASVRDKSIAGFGTLFWAALRLLISYPRALTRLLRRRSHLALLLPYPAIPDIFVAWPIARLRGDKIIFDAFISVHDTLVGDRAMLRSNSLSAKLLWWTERIALRMADIILVDTDQHGDFFANEFGIERERIVTVLVGAEPAFWEARGLSKPRPPHPAFASGHPIALFYGQLIPLHGIDTILEAIRFTHDEPIHWLLIGNGQEEAKLRRFLAENGDANVSWIPWVDYGQLPAIIRAASVGLGIFGTSEKAGRVIPNKVFQILAAGKPLITRSSPAISSLAARSPETIKTVPAGNGSALAAAVTKHLTKAASFRPLPLSAQADFGPGHGIDALLKRL